MMNALKEDNNTNLQTTLLKDVMTKSPISVLEKNLASEALSLMEDKKISAIPIINSENYLVGVLSMHDLLKAGLI